MKIGAFKTGLTNPAFLAMLGIDAFNAFDTARTNAAYRRSLEDPEWTNAALAAGHPVTEQPGGFFRQGISKLTGGLVSPNEQATPGELAGEQVALRGQQKEKLGELNQIYEFRKNAGAGVFGHVMAGSPLANALADTNTSAEDLQQPTPADLKEQKAEEHQQKVEQHQTDVEKRLEKGQRDTEAYQQHEEKNSDQRLRISEAGLRDAQRRMTPEYQTMAAKSHAIGTAEAIPEMTLPEFNKVGVFIDHDLNIVPPNGAKNVGEAMAKYGAPISQHELPYFRLAKTAVGEIDKRDALAAKLLVHTAGMSPGQAQKAVAKRYAELLWKGASDPDIRTWKDTAFSTAIQPAVTALQHRSASASLVHLDAPSFGDSSMSYEAAHQNLMAMRQTLKDQYVNTLTSGSPTKALSDAMSALPAADKVVQDLDSGAPNE